MHQHRGFGYPFEEACQVALDVISGYLNEHDQIEKVVLVCYSQADFERYSRLLDAMR